MQDSSTAIVAVRDSVVGGRIRMQSIDDYIRGECPRRPGIVTRGILIVRVVDSTMHPVPGLRITSSTALTRMGPWTDLPIGRTGKNGQFIACEANDRKALPTEGVLRVPANDERFLTNVVEIDLAPDVRLLTTLLCAETKR